MLETFRLPLRAAVLALVVALAGWAQMIPRRPRITSRISESRLETLRNNVHPLARVGADRGRVPEDWPMERMLLVLQRSGAQESALDQFLEEQQYPESRQYHRWLTPEQFGEQFGANEADIRTVTEWLTGQGFRVNRVASGRTHVEFSGTAGQVEQTFHTELRKYSVNGQEHIANARDPQIPAALTPVVAGVATLHNFSKHSELHQATEAITATIQAGRQPQLTSASGAHYLSPRDFALLYNVDAPYSSPLPASATIALVGRSNINVSDVNTFRNSSGYRAALLK